MQKPNWIAFIIVVVHVIYYRSTGQHIQIENGVLIYPNTKNTFVLADLLPLEGYIEKRKKSTLQKTYQSIKNVMIFRGWIKGILIWYGEKI